MAASGAETVMDATGPQPPARPMTRTQEATLRAYLVEGSVKAAARSLEVPQATVRSRLHSARRRTGLLSLAHLAYWMDRRPG